MLEASHDEQTGVDRPGSDATSRADSAERSYELHHHCTEFGFEGKSYTIDLTNSEADDLEKAISKYIENGARTSGARRSGVRSAKSSTNGDAGAIREWAKAQGMDVSERGRISSEVREAYQAAQ